MLDVSEVYRMDVFDQLIFLKKSSMKEKEWIIIFFCLLREEPSFISLLWQVVTISLLGKIRLAVA